MKETLIWNTFKIDKYVFIVDGRTMNLNSSSSPLNKDLFSFKLVVSSALTF